MYIVSFDPGETTGYAVAQWDTGRDFALLKTGEIPWDNRFSEVRTLLKFYRPEYVVAESFRLYSHRAESQIGKDFPSVRVLGIIETYLYEEGLQPFVLQPANVRGNVKILAVHAPRVLRSAHTVDAYKHLRYFIVVNLPRLLKG